jgi:hypothetical protein
MTQIITWSVRTNVLTLTYQPNINISMLLQLWCPWVGSLIPCIDVVYWHHWMSPLYTSNIGVYNNNPCGMSRCSTNKSQIPSMILAWVSPFGVMYYYESPMCTFDKFHLTLNFKSKVSHDVFKNKNGFQLTSTYSSKVPPQCHIPCHFDL